MTVIGQYERHCPECEGQTWHRKDVQGLHIQWTCRNCGNVTDTELDTVGKAIETAILTDETDDATDPPLTLREVEAAQMRATGAMAPLIARLALANDDPRDAAKRLLDMHGKSLEFHVDRLLSSILAG